MIIIKNQKGFSMIDSLVGVGTTMLVALSFTGILKTSWENSTKIEYETDADALTDTIQQTVLREPACTDSFRGQRLNMVFEDGEYTGPSFQWGMHGTRISPGLVAEGTKVAQYTPDKNLILQEVAFYPTSTVPRTLPDGTLSTHHFTVAGDLNLQFKTYSEEEYQWAQTSTFCWDAGIAGGCMTIPWRYLSESKYFYRKVGIVFNGRALGRNNQRFIVNSCTTNDIEVSEKVCDMQGMDYVASGVDNDGNAVEGRCISRQVRNTKWFNQNDRFSAECDCNEGWAYDGGWRVNDSTDDPTQGYPYSRFFNYDEWIDGIADPVVAAYDDGNGAQTQTYTDWLKAGRDYDQCGDRNKIVIQYNDKLDQLQNPPFADLEPQLVAHVRCWRMEDPQ